MIIDYTTSYVFYDFPSVNFYNQQEIMRKTVQSSIRCCQVLPHNRFDRGFFVCKDFRFGNRPQSSSQCRRPCTASLQFQSIQKPIIVNLSPRCHHDIYEEMLEHYPTAEIIAYILLIFTFGTKLWITLSHQFKV